MSTKHEVTKAFRKYGKEIEVKRCIECGKIKLYSDSLNCLSPEISRVWIDYKVPPGINKKDTCCCSCLEEYTKNHNNPEGLINDLEKGGWKVFIWVIWKFHSVYLSSTLPSNPDFCA